MGGTALNKIGIETERKSTKDLYRIFNEIKNYFNGYHITMTKFYSEKETHGDLDILVKTKDANGLIDIVNNKINPEGVIVNDDAISFDYDNFQVDLITIDPEIWNTAIVYYSYDPVGNLLGKISKGFGLRYGKDGLYYKSISKSNTKKMMLSQDNEEIFKFLGYDFNEFKKGFNTLEDIYKFISNGKYYDRELFDPNNLTNMDRKRSMKRPTFKGFLKYEKGVESKYTFKNKESYIDYIDSWFPGFKKEVEKHKQIDNIKVDINKKLRLVLSNFKPSKVLGDVVNYYRLSKSDFQYYILNTDLEDIEIDFSEFYIRYIELDRMMDKSFEFGKKMGNDVYMHKNYESYLPSDILKENKSLLPKDFNYTIIKWNKKDNSMSFIESKDFDTSDEPIVDSSYKVSNGNIRLRDKPKRDQIYHHKWMFVQPDYTGFNYDESKLRSLSWYKKYDYDSKMIGYKDYWDKLKMNESYTIEEMEIANKTSRTSKNPGAVSNNAIVPKFVLQYANQNDLILDYGSGKYPLHALRLKEKGYNVKSHDFGRNFNSEFHDVDALDNQYDVVYASNVLNVQSSEIMLKSTIEQIIGLMKKDAIFIANYPQTPRKMDLSFVDIKDILSEYFDVASLGKNVMLMKIKSANENLYSKRVVGNFETFTLNIRDYDITKNNQISHQEQYGSRNIGWEDIFKSNSVTNPNYIKPYEKGNFKL